MSSNKNEPVLRLEDIPRGINDDIDRRINDYAIRAFRDLADKDYIAARMAESAELMHQYLWSAQQAVEKYLKCILLLNRVPAKKVGHNIAEALQLSKRLPFELDLNESSLKLMGHLAAYGPDRYLETSPYIYGHIRIDLDRTVWELRRYCQVLYCNEEKLLPIEIKQLRDARDALQSSREKPPYKFALRGGFLELVINTSNHPARAPLLRHNAFFGSRARKYVKSKSHLQIVNSPLFLFPQMIEELSRYVHFSKEALAAYRELAKARLQTG